ncbi:sulfatase [Candidatus Dependentiae bacterium]|nr:sulfatase [Candidatus Dependentiae bacterium]
MDLFFKNQIKLKLIFLKKFIKGNKWFRNRSQLFQKFEKKLDLINRYYSIDNINGVEITGFKNKSLEKVFNFGFDEVYSTGLNKSIEINFNFPSDIVSLSFYFGFLEIPNHHLKRKFQITMLINEKEIKTKVIHPRDYFRKNKYKDNLIELSWQHNSLRLKKFLNQKLNIKIVFSSKDTSCKEAVQFGITRLKFIKQIHRPRNINKKNKNIIIVLSDALRYDKVFTELTPFLNSMRSEIKNLTPSYSVAPWTWPSVPSILTGVYPFKHGIYRFDKHELNPKVKMIGEIFQENGYITSCFSSNPLIKRKYQFDRGFDFFMELPLVSLDNYLPFIKDWITYFKHYNFFSYIHCMDTHTPYIAPARYLKKLKVKQKNLSPEIVQNIIHDVNEQGNNENLNHDVLEEIKKMYDAQVMYFDNSMRKLIDFLKKEKVFDNTIILVLSDHGEEFMEHSNLAHGYSFYEALSRVPLLIINGDIKDLPEREFYSTLDIFPSLLELSGLKTNQKSDGLSILKAVSDRDLFLATHHYYIKGEGWFPKFGLIYKGYKLIYFPKLKSWELYNLKKDPQELKNIYNESQKLELLKEIKIRLSTYITKDDESYLPEDQSLSDDLKNTLKGLGYI